MLISSLTSRKACAFATLALAALALSVLPGGAVAQSARAASDMAPPLEQIEAPRAGLGITEAEFYGMVDELRSTMRVHGVGLRERNEMLRILAPMKRDVVELCSTSRGWWFSDATFTTR